jgi:phosphoribosylformylglycinamidine cyclo-ligase
MPKRRCAAMPRGEAPSLTYSEAGVDLEAADDAVRRISDLVARTHGPEVLSGIGGFGGVFAPRLSDTPDPVLVAGADSVGSKLKVAFAAGRHDTVGIDAVAMCVNDVLCQGAMPLFFLDYIGIGKLEPGVVERIVSGVAEGCRQAECALLGGETAELPGLYSEGEYDLAGFAVGMVARQRLIDGSRVRAGDRLIGLASSGLHSNGYALARRVVFDVAGLGPDDLLPGAGGTVADVLLEPTRIYVAAVRRLMDAVPVVGLAHITGGGLPGNVPRAFGPELAARVEAGAWDVPPVFRFLAEAGPVAEEEMLRTFNVGLGMVAVVPDGAEGDACSALAEAGVDAAVVGAVVERGDGGAFELTGRVLG